jgi:hypothetical protein
MATKVQNIRTPRQRTEDIFARMSDEQLRCMAGGRHRFPTDEMDPNSTEPPAGMHTELRKGVYSITEECLRGCGRIRKFSTRSGGLFDTDTVYQYSDKKGTEVVHISQDEREELGIRPRLAKAVLFDRNLPMLKRAAQAS